MPAWKPMVAVALFLAATATTAQPRLYRCRQANGQWVFQGQPCAAGETPSDADRGHSPETTPGVRTAAVPARCEVVPQHFPLADPALDGAELTLLLRRDADGHQIVLRLAGVVERDAGPVPVQFSERLGAQGLRFDDGERISPDFRRGDREIGWGYARSAALLDRAAKSSLVDVEVEPRGYAQSLLSAPLTTTALTAARSEMLRCHLLRERVRKASDAERAEQAGQGSGDAEAPRQ